MHTKMTRWEHRFWAFWGVVCHSLSASNHEQKYGDFSGTICHWVITLTPNGAKVYCIHLWTKPC